MKHHLLMLGSAAALLALPLAGCSGDDDNDMGTGRPINLEALSPTAVFETPAGNQVAAAAIGEISLGWNARGFCTGVTTPDADLRILYNKGLIIINNGDYIATMAMNLKGYITRIEYEASDPNANNNYDRGTIVVDYDSDGHLIRVTDSREYSVADTESGTDEIGSYELNLDLSWIGGDLVVTSFKKEGEANGEGYKTQGKTVYDDGEANRLGQYTLAYASAFDELGIFSALSLGGLLGKAPEHFPIEMTMSGSDSEKRTLSCSYTLNSNGTIASETIGDTVAPYRYVFL